MPSEYSGFVFTQNSIVGIIAVFSPPRAGLIAKILPAVQGFCQGFAGRNVKVPTIPWGWGDVVTNVLCIMSWEDEWCKEIPQTDSLTFSIF